MKILQKVLGGYFFDSRCIYTYVFTGLTDNYMYKNCGKPNASGLTAHFNMRLSRWIGVSRHVQIFITYLFSVTDFRLVNPSPILTERVIYRCTRKGNPPVSGFRVRWMTLVRIYRSLSRSTCIYTCGYTLAPHSRLNPQKQVYIYTYIPVSAGLGDYVRRQCIPARV